MPDINKVRSREFEESGGRDVKEVESAKVANKFQREKRVFSILIELFSATVLFTV